MANTFMANVKPDFNMEEFASKLAETYRAKGFTSNSVTIDDMQIINFEKNTGGISMVTGLGIGIKATCTVSNDTLTINY